MTNSSHDPAVLLSSVNSKVKETTQCSMPCAHTHTRARAHMHVLHAGNMWRGKIFVEFVANLPNCYLPNVLVNKIHRSLKFSPLPIGSYFC